MNIFFKSSNLNYTFHRNFVVVLVWFISFSFAQGQPRPRWDRTYGGTDFEQLNAGTATQDEGFLFCGMTSSVNSGDVSERSRGGQDFWFLKTDSLGRKIFDKRLGGVGLDLCWSVIQNSEGYLLIGQTDSPRDSTTDKWSANYGESDFWIVQVNPNGRLIWEKSFGGSKRDEAFCGLAMGDGYLILGHSNSPSSGNKTSGRRGNNDSLDLWLIKIDRNGNKIWDKTYGGSGSDDFPSATLCKSDDGNYFIACGSTSGRSIDKTDVERGVKDVWLLKIDPDGNKIWDRSYGGDLEDVVKSVVTAPDRTLILAGSTRSQPSGDKESRSYGGLDYWILKVRQDNGNIIWERTLGGSFDDNLYAAHQNATGYLLIAGVSSSLQNSGNKRDSLRGLNDYWLCYLDRNGNKVWDKSIGGSGDDAPTTLIPLADKGYIVAGQSNSIISGEKTQNGNGQNDFWITKIRCIFELDLGPDTLVCKRSEIPLNATIAGCPNCLYEWKMNDSIFSNTPRVRVSPDSTMRIFVKVTDTDACEILDDIELLLVPSPDSISFFTVPPQCYDGSNGTIALDYVRNGTPPYSLAFRGDTLRRQIFLTGLKAGTYNVGVVDANGCGLQQNMVVPNPPPFLLDITPSTEINVGDSLLIRVQTNHPLDTFFWSERKVKTLSTLVKPTETKVYWFTGIDTLGCSKTVSTQITVRKDNLWFAPNVFSPNGDGFNDYFTMQGGNFVKQISNLKIYDRWGGQVFQSNGVVFPARDDAGWNGKFQDRDVSPGVYIFIADVLFTDGHTENAAGDFTLIK